MTPLDYLTGSKFLIFSSRKKPPAAASRLVTAADRELAESIARYLGLFDEVHASDGQINLKGASKAAFLAQHFAGTGFEYVGDSAADVEVWRHARAAYVVGTEARAEQAAAVTAVKGTILEPRASFRTSSRTWINAIRGHHWAKNLLLFLPLALSHNLALKPLVRTLVGFALFGFCASGLYILNDLLDLHSDREHPWKKERPFAAGEISIPEGLLASFLLVAAALGWAFFSICNSAWPWSDMSSLQCCIRSISNKSRCSTFLFFRVSIVFAFLRER